MCMRDSADSTGNEYQRLHHSDGPLSRSGDHRCDKAVCCVTFTRSGKGTIHIIAAGWSMILNIIRLSESKYCHIIRDFFEILHPERGLREPQTGLTPGEPPSWSWLTPTPGKYNCLVQESELMRDTHLLRSVIKLCKLGRLDKPLRTHFNPYVNNAMKMHWTDQKLKRRMTKEEESTSKIDFTISTLD